MTYSYNVIEIWRLEAEDLQNINEYNEFKKMLIPILIDIRLNLNTAPLNTTIDSEVAIKQHNINLTYKYLSNIIFLLSENIKRLSKKHRKDLDYEFNNLKEFMYKNNIELKTSSL